MAFYTFPEDENKSYEERFEMKQKPNYCFLFVIAFFTFCLVLFVISFIILRYQIN